MSNKQTNDPKGKNTSAGGHLGGTKFGQAPDSKTTSNDNGRKERPNDGRN